jgi:diacylglycerol kinase (ATP)
MSRRYHGAAMSESSAPSQRPLENPHKGKTGLIRLRNAMRYSIDGIRAALRHEDAFRQEILAVFVLTPVALLLEPSGIGRALMIGSMLIVLVVELLNSAIEAAVDRISFEDHRLAKRAKDIGSAAVFMSLISVLVIWGLILL